MIEQRGNGAAFICLKDATNFSEDELDSVSLEKNTTGLLVKHFEVRPSGAVGALPDASVLSLGAKCRNTQHVLTNYVHDKKKTYLKLNDFDDHFADLTLDWRNPEINA